MKDVILNIDRMSVVDGDLEVNESSNQHQSMLIQGGVGFVRHFPVVGASLSEQILAENPDDLIIRIKKSYKLDGLNIKSINIVSGNLQIDASYENL
jgi:hypothetical protein